MTGRQGSSERRSRPWLREWEGPAAVAVGRIAPTGRTDPKASAGPSMRAKGMTKIFCQSKNNSYHCAAEGIVG